MDNWTKIITRVLAGVFFIIGAMYLPFAVWLPSSHSSNPAIGWFIYLVSVGGPWAIATLLLLLGNSRKRK